MVDARPEGRTLWIVVSADSRSDQQTVDDRMNEDIVHYLERIDHRLGEIEAAIAVNTAIDSCRDYTRAEVARVLGRCPRTVDRLIRSGFLIARKQGHSVRVLGSSLQRFKRSLQSNGKVEIRNL